MHEKNEFEIIAHNHIVSFNIDSQRQQERDTNIYMQKTIRFYRAHLD